MPPKVLFADTFYWVALIFPRDSSHARVRSFSSTLGLARLVTTDEVLTEVLNHLCHFGAVWRAKAAALVHDVRSNPNCDVLTQSRANFDAALALYEARPARGTASPTAGRWSRCRRWAFPMC
jgi:predicted nucleic acid-binding protein